MVTNEVIKCTELGQDADKYWVHLATFPRSQICSILLYIKLKGVALSETYSITSINLDFEFLSQTRRQALVAKDDTCRFCIARLLNFSGHALLIVSLPEEDFLHAGRWSYKVSWFSSFARVKTCSHAFCRDTRLCV